MDPRAAADAYRNASIENAPPIKIVRLLYQTALRNLEQARAEDPRDPRSRFTDLVFRTDAIVSELRMALDAEHNPAVAADLERLYVFVESALGRAQVERDAAPLEDARRVLEPLLEAWNGVALASGEPA